MVEKPFFKPRSEAQIMALGESKEVYNLRTLVSNPLQQNTSYLVRCNIAPGYFAFKDSEDYVTSREYEKRGPTIPLEHPATLRECASSGKTLMDMLVETFRNNQEFHSPSDNTFLGYHMQPSWFGDKLRRVTFFADVMEGMLLYLHSELNEPIIVQYKYSGINSEESHGADMVVTVPSRREGKPPYTYKVQHVPVHPRGNNLGVVLTLKTNASISEGFRKPGSTNWRDFRYHGNHLRENAERIIFSPQDIAAYFAMARTFANKGNIIPLKYSPFFIPTEEFLVDYLSLRDNCLKLKSNTNRDEWRHLHKPEISRLLSLMAARRMKDINSVFSDSLDKENYKSLLKNEISKNMEGQ